MRAFRTLLGVVLVLVLVCVAVVLLAFRTIPDHDTDSSKFDALIVLGTPSKPDGTPSPELRERVEEAVREYKAGVAPHVIMTGGPAHNKFVEAEVMAKLAEDEGVPASAIEVEGQAKNTVDNIWFSHAIMDQRGWHSAEVISSPYHLPRTALILEQYTGPLHFTWRTHASHWPPEYGLLDKSAREGREAIGCLQIRTQGFRPSPHLPKKS